MSIDKMNLDLSNKIANTTKKVKEINEVIKNITFPYNHLVTKDVVLKASVANPPWGSYIRDVQTLKRGEIVEIESAVVDSTANYGMFSFGMGDPFVALKKKDNSYILVNVADLNQEDKTVNVDEVFVEATDEKVSSLKKEMFWGDFNKKYWYVYLLIPIAGYFVYKKFKK
tara:strand:+ start:76 stop:585 length:510 start_codon:yes stop_codon:yes gene_type:complete